MEQWHMRTDLCMQDSEEEHDSFLRVEEKLAKE
jgi:hypothetical protein